MVDGAAGVMSVFLRLTSVLAGRGEPREGEELERFPEWLKKEVEAANETK